MKNYQFLVMEIKNIHENIQIMKINKVEIKIIGSFSVKSKERLNQASIGTNTTLESTCMSRFEDLGVLLKHLGHVLMASAKPVDQRCGRTTPASQKHE